MVNGVSEFGKKTGQAGGVLIHVSELLVFRFQLDLMCLGLETKTVSSPSGRFIGIPPTQEGAVDAIQLSFNPAALEAIDSLEKEYAPKQVNLPTMVEIDGVSTMLRPEFLVKAEAEYLHYAAGEYQCFKLAAMQTVNQLLDEQFPFLPAINGVELREMLLTVPVGGAVDEDYLSGKRIMGNELFDACCRSIQSQVGSEWALLEQDPQLAYKIRTATRESIEIYEKSFQP